VDDIRAANEVSHLAGQVENEAAPAEAGVHELVRPELGQEGHIDPVALQGLDLSGNECRRRISRPDHDDFHDWKAD
jgi:hypothetical protein